MLDHGWFRYPLRLARRDAWNWRAGCRAVASWPRKVRWGVRFYLRTLMAEVRQETASTSDTQERYRQLDRQQLAAEKLHRATLSSRIIRRDDADG